MSSQRTGAIQFYDQHPEPVDFYSEVITGLKQEQKRIPPKFFYDETGSKLFDQICELPEYYPTRTEMALLRQHADEIAALIGEECLLIEPGSGSSQKVRLLLDALMPRAYIPMDISRRYLFDVAQQLADEYHWLDVHATCVDFTAKMELQYCPEDVHKVAFFPGSSIGNFEPEDAGTFLANIAEMVGKGGGLLIGVDLKKSADTLNQAYNDKQSVTAEFNLNLLNRINRELDGNFDIDSFEHRAFYNSRLGRIEMHLLSKRDQIITVGEQSICMTNGETIHTENSYKYSVEEFSALASQAGLAQISVWIDEQQLFSLHYYQVRE